MSQPAVPVPHNAVTRTFAVWRVNFVFFGHDDTPGMSVKLPESAEAALTLACATPTGYGLGRSGWVSVDFRADDCPAAEVLVDWVEESYRAIAPKRLVKELDARAAGG
jgi:hypothetical protein